MKPDRAPWKAIVYLLATVSWIVIGLREPFSPSFRARIEGPPRGKIAPMIEDLYIVIRVHPADSARWTSAQLAAVAHSVASAIGSAERKGAVDSAAMPPGCVGAFVVAAVSPGGGPPDPTIPT